MQPMPLEGMQAPPRATPPATPRGAADAKGPSLESVFDRFVEASWRVILARTPRQCPQVDLAALELDLKAQLCKRLLLHCQRTLVLELNVARLLGLLQGDTPAQRFASFVERLRTQPDAWESVLAEYPILAQRVITEQQRFVGHIIEVLTRLTTDWDAITATFPDAQQTMHLIAMVGDLSDGHRGGRSVWKLTFACTDANASTSARHHDASHQKCASGQAPVRRIASICSSVPMAFCSRCSSLTAVTAFPV